MTAGVLCPCTMEGVWQGAEGAGRLSERSDTRKRASRRRDFARAASLSVSFHLFVRKSVYPPRLISHPPHRNRQSRSDITQYRIFLCFLARVSPRSRNIPRAESGGNHVTIVRRTRDQRITEGSRVAKHRGALLRAGSFDVEPTWEL